MGEFSFCLLRCFYSLISGHRPLEYHGIVEVFPTVKQFRFHLKTRKSITTKILYATITNENRFGGLKADEPPMVCRSGADTWLVGLGQLEGQKRPFFAYFFQASEKSTSAAGRDSRS